MKPDAIYYFERISECQNHYKQVAYKGHVILDFPAIYENGKYEGEKYVIFQRTRYYYDSSNLRFTHVIELAQNHLITGLYFLPEFPNQTYGSYKGYGLLIDFSENWEQLKIWFFKGLHESTPILFQKWQAGGIPEVTGSNALQIRYRISLSTL